MKLRTSITLCFIIVIGVLQSKAHGQCPFTCQMDVVVGDPIAIPCCGPDSNFPCYAHCGAQSPESSYSRDYDPYTTLCRRLLYDNDSRVECCMYGQPPTPCFCPDSFDPIIGDEPCPPDDDTDGDGVPDVLDCEPTIPSIYPGNPLWQICAQYNDLDCNGMDDFLQCQQMGSPILIDVAGDGYNLTSKESGVEFDVDADGMPEQRSWTTMGDDDAWLVLDRDGDGFVSNGTELFGGLTPQPDPIPGILPNGFLALAVFDKYENGGNTDGRIDNRDAIFGLLRLWTDLNHNGISEPNELYSLESLGITGIDLDYHISKKTDEHGNLFRYRSKVYHAQGKKVNRWAWDVILLGQ